MRETSGMVPCKMIAGPVDVNSTGCLLQKIGFRYYAIFGSSEQKLYVYSYPDLKQLGELDMHRKPWNDGDNSRCWPSVIPLPGGYPKNGDRVVYEYSEDENR